TSAQIVVGPATVDTYFGDGSQATIDSPATLAFSLPSPVVISAPPTTPPVPTTTAAPVPSAAPAPSTPARSRGATPRAASFPLAPAVAGGAGTVVVIGLALALLRRRRKPSEPEVDLRDITDWDTPPGPASGAGADDGHLPSSPPQPERE